MFCALKGATRTPSRASHRHRPATTTLLPTPDEVPTTSNAPMARGYGRLGGGHPVAVLRLSCPALLSGQPRLAGSGPSVPRGAAGSRRTALTGRWSLPRRATPSRS